MKKLAVIVLIVVCIIYILNPTAGVFELLPDNIPFLGNLDEGLAFALIVACIRYLKSGTFTVIR